MKRFFLCLSCLQLFIPSIVQATSIEQQKQSEKITVVTEKSTKNSVSNTSETVEKSIKENAEITSSLEIPDSRVPNTLKNSTETSEKTQTMEDGHSINVNTEMMTILPPAPLLESMSEEINNLEELTKKPMEKTSNIPEEKVAVEQSDKEKSSNNTKETLSDDTVITISPILLQGIKEEVELVAKDKITIRELKKIRRILVLTFEKLDSLEGLQYAENLVELVFVTTNLDTYTFDDLTPLSNLENLRYIHLYNTKVTDFRPLKKMAEKIKQGIPPAVPIDFPLYPGISITTTIDARQAEQTKFDPFNKMDKIHVNPDGKSWDFEMPFYSYDGSRLEINGGEIQYTGLGNTARIGEDIENVFQIKLKNRADPDILIEVDYISQLEQPSSPFLQKMALRGILTEIDRETLEQKIIDFGIIKEVYGYVGETLHRINEWFEESKPVQSAFTETFQRNASEAVIHYVDKAIDEGLSYIKLNYRDISGQTLKSSDLYIRAAETNFTLPLTTDITGYSLIEESPEEVKMPAKGETLEINYVYGKILMISDPVLEQQLYKALNMDSSQPLTDHAMLQLETFSYDASSATRIKDVSGLQYAHNLQKLVLVNQEIGHTLSDTVTRNLKALTYLDLSKNQNQMNLGSLYYTNQLTHLLVNESDFKISEHKYWPKNLEVLAMAKMRMSAIDLSVLSSSYLNQLKRMDLSDNQGKITNESLVHIAQAAKNNPLEYVDLSGNQLSDLSVLSEIEDLRYVPAGSQPDFTADRGWNLANQTLSGEKRLTAGKEIRFENLVKNKKGEAYLPATGDVDYRIENNDVIWSLDFKDDGSLEKEKAVFQYEGYQDTNYSATFTLALQYQPLKVEIPLSIQFKNDGNTETVHSPEYQLVNHSAFPVEISLEKVEAGANNSLPLVEELQSGIEGISLILKTDRQSINLAKTGNKLDEIAVGKAMPFSLEGRFFTNTTAEKKLDYTFQFTFKESGDLSGKTTEK